MKTLQTPPPEELAPPSGSPLPETCRGACCLENGKGEIEDPEIVWGWWGDYQCWHIDVFRSAIKKRYGEDAVSALEKGEDGVWFFRHLAGVDWALIGQDIGVAHSDPSEGSSSSSDSESPKNVQSMASQPHNPRE